MVSSHCIGHWNEVSHILRVWLLYIWVTCDNIFTLNKECFYKLLNSCIADTASMPKMILSMEYSFFLTHHMW